MLSIFQALVGLVLLHFHAGTLCGDHRGAAVQVVQHSSKQPLSPANGSPTHKSALAVDTAQSSIANVAILMCLDTRFPPTLGGGGAIKTARTFV